MATTKERALDAALALVGEQGIRALTHARVDERAGLPKGSTSNWFRTRDALLTGVAVWLAESERADFAAAKIPPVDTPAQLVDALSEMIWIETGRFAARTRARYALFLEGARDPALLAPLVEQRRVYVQWTTDLLAHVGPARHRASGARQHGLIPHPDLLVSHRWPISPLVGVASVDVGDHLDDEPGV